ncbi:MAG: c-type cytochrome [Amylibacter sp.]|nr:c-type cytochrome [Amylibacter sp.]
MKILLSALAVITLFSGQIAVAQDVDAGKKVFKKCKACHKVGENAKNGVGPDLNDIVGRVVGSAEGYKYSKTFKAANAAGLVWDEASIADYIANPNDYMKAALDDPKAKTKMSFKMKKEQQRKDVAAYVASFSAAPAAD